MWYYKIVDKIMIVKGEKKLIHKLYRKKRFGRYNFAEDDNGCCYEMKDCKKIKHGEAR